MDLSNLPSEMQRKIRTYGFNPYVSDEDLYKMIYNMGYSYSLMSLYDRLVKWKCDLDLNKEGRYRYNSDIKDNNVSKIDEGQDLMMYMYTLQDNPVNSTEVIENKGYSLEYTHYYSKPRVSINDFDPDLLNLIKEIYPSYSLQNEYTNLSMRKQYSDSLKPEYANLLTKHDKELLKIVYYMRDQSVSIVLDDYLEEQPEFLEEPYEYFDEDAISYKIKDSSLELFQQMIAFISPRITVRNRYENIIYPTYKLPFQSKPEY